MSLMLKFIRVIVIVYGGTLFSHTLTSDDNIDTSITNLRSVGAWPGHSRGPALDVALIGQYAFVAIGYGGVIILDVSNPASPKRVGHFGGYGFINLLKIAQNRLYVGSRFHRGNQYEKEGYRGKLLIFDVSNPIHPSLLGTHILGTEIQSFDVQENIILIGEGNQRWGHTASSLRILDTTNPSLIRTLDVLQLRGNASFNQFNSPGMVAIDQDRVYVSGYYANYKTLLMSEVSESGKYKILGKFLPEDHQIGSVYHVQVQDSLLYVSGHSMNLHKNVLQVFDLRQEDAPTLVGSVDITNTFLELNQFPELEVKQGKAIACLKRLGVELIDVQEPKKPINLGHINTPGSAIKAEWRDNFIYIADYDGGLQIAEIQEQTGFNLIGHYDTELTPDVFQISDNRGYLLSQNSSPYISFAPSILDEWNVRSQIECVDLSNPNLPTLLGRLELSHHVNSFTVSGHTAYAGWIDDDIAKVKTFDLTDPGAPKLYGETRLTTEKSETDSIELLAIDHPPRLYVSEKTKRNGHRQISLTKIFDFENPSKPLLIAEFSMGGAVSEGMKWHDQLLFQNVFSSNSQDQLVTYDPNLKEEAPVESVLEIEGRSWNLLGRKKGGLALNNPYAFMGLSWRGFSIVDIANPFNPKFQSIHSTGGEVHDLAVSENYLYTAEGWQGFSVYDVAKSAHAHRVVNQMTPGPATNLKIAHNHAYILNKATGLDIYRLRPPSLVLTTHPNSQSISFGKQATLGVSSFAPNATTYQWFRGESNDTSHPIPGATEMNFTTPGIEQTEHFWVQVSAGTDLISSKSAVISPTPAVKVELVGRWPSEQTLPAYRGFATDVAISGELVYLASGTGGLQIIQVANPGIPVLKTNYRFNVQNLKIHNQVLYLQTATLRIFDIQDPLQFKEIQRFKEDVSALFPYGHWTYIGSNKGLQLYDQRTPLNSDLDDIDLISKVHEWRVSDITISKNIAAIGQKWGGIQFLDVSQPNSPEFFSGYYPNASIHRLAWANSKILTTHMEPYSGLELVDLNDPLQPKRLAYVDLQASNHVTVIDGSYACVTGKGLQVFDYGNPTQLVHVGASERSDQDTFGIAVKGNLAYVAAGKDGLLIFKITPQLNLMPPAIENGQLKLSWLGAPDIVLQSRTPGTSAGWKDIQDSAGKDKWTSKVQTENTWFRLIKK